MAKSNNSPSKPKRSPSSNTRTGASSGRIIRPWVWSRRRRDKESGRKTYAYDPHLDSQLRLGRESGADFVRSPNGLAPRPRAHRPAHDRRSSEPAQIKDGEDKGKYQIELIDFDYYNAKTGTIESGGNEKIAIWMLDTGYDGRSLLPRQAFFSMAGNNDGWARLARNLKAEIDEEFIEKYRGTVSLPFESVSTNVLQ